jgi:two-component system chemotaxis response regulator CheB
MPPGYTAAFAKRLDEDCAISVVEASDGLVLRPGQAVVARAGDHLKLHRAGSMITAHLEKRPAGTLHMPSVDVLFESVANAPARDVLAVVLTGMGDDGALGAHALSKQGATILTEAESSCVVYGMPRSVREAGLSTAEAPLAAMAALILRHL